MLALLSPAKSLETRSPLATKKHSQPRMLDEAARLIETLRTLSPSDLQRLMHVSEGIAALNHQRFLDFEVPFTPSNSRPAVLLFAGDVYVGMDAAGRFGERDFTAAQKTLRILSGLYGLLRPLDLIQPYRLEMGTKLRTDRGADLYHWWGSTITDLLRADLEASPGSKAVINLASNEYSSAVDFDAMGVRVISPRFEDRSPKGEYKVMSFHAKKARGEMAAWLVLNRVRAIGDLTDFDAAGYRYRADISTPAVPVFRR